MSNEENKGSNKRVIEPITARRLTVIKKLALVKNFEYFVFFMKQVFDDSIT